jgi:hypothetical protein
MSDDLIHAEIEGRPARIRAYLRLPADRVCRASSPTS